jgi:hypothetical protein
MGASIDALSSSGGVVRSIDTTTNALPPRMVRAYLGFWPWKLLRRRWPLRTRQPPVGHEGFGIGKPDSLECQTRPSGFPRYSGSSWPPAWVRGTEEWIFFWSIGEQSGEDRAGERIFGQWRSQAQRGEKSWRGGSRAEQGSGGENKEQDKSQNHLTTSTKVDSPVSQIGPSGFSNFRTEESVEDYHTCDGSSTSLVSSKPHA